MTRPSRDQEGFEFARTTNPLTEERLPAHNRTPTSIEAARAIAPRAPNLRERVYCFIREAGEAGATGSEIKAATGIKHQTLGPRLCELHSPRDGTAPRIKDSGGTRKSVEGHEEIVWITC